MPLGGKVGVCASILVPPLNILPRWCQVAAGSRRASRPSLPMSGRHSVLVGRPWHYKLQGTATTHVPLLPASRRVSPGCCRLL